MSYVFILVTEFIQEKFSLQENFSSKGGGVMFLALNCKYFRKMCGHVLIKNNFPIHEIDIFFDRTNPRINICK